MDLKRTNGQPAARVFNSTGKSFHQNGKAITVANPFPASDFYDFSRVIDAAKPKHHPTLLARGMEDASKALLLSTNRFVQTVLKARQHPNTRQLDLVYLKTTDKTFIPADSPHSRFTITHRTHEVKPLTGILDAIKPGQYKPLSHWQMNKPGQHPGDWLGLTGQQAGALRQTARHLGFKPDHPDTLRHVTQHQADIFARLFTAWEGKGDMAMALRLAQKNGRIQYKPVDGVIEQA
jgi:hypothetical protein